MASSVTFLAAPSPCQYLPDRLWQLRYEVSPAMHPQDYMDRLRDGWRRFGPVLFRPECPSCRMCQSLRVPVATFRPSTSQRRAWKRNTGEVTIRIDTPTISPQKLDLYARFQQHGHAAKGWPAEGEPSLALIVANPFKTEEWSYWLEDRLVGVGYVDPLPEGLSAVYFYWEPADAKRSLGVFNILTVIADAKRRGLPHVYLGYYVRGCRSLEYKARFRSNEILNEAGEWRSFAT